MDEGVVMKIDVKHGDTKTSLENLKEGTAFWWGGQLYMKLHPHTDTKKWNVVGLSNGVLHKWNLDGPVVAKVKIVDDKD